MILVDKNKLLQLVTAIQYSVKDLANASIFSMSEKIEAARILNDKCWQDLMDYLDGCHENKEEI